MAFAMLLSAVSAILFALLPALRAARFTLAPALHGSHSTADRDRAWLRQGLVAGQVAMALLLLVAAGLFVRSLQQAATIDAGSTSTTSIRSRSIRESAVIAPTPMASEQSTA